MDDLRAMIELRLRELRQHLAEVEAEALATRGAIGELMCLLDPSLREQGKPNGEPAALPDD